ncbi:unnamed protein product [Spirodela intermedia]|uniref:Uncharacterized protein n=1 Tax=Spirodela intermedia TaxID=51605 RepID=A0A7I8JU50_SPIIN|nr:unnamed protein product [Spirodela intermedia]CAA6672982.1 unnamed protein product [Spirodela intermedia]
MLEHYFSIFNLIFTSWSNNLCDLNLPSYTSFNYDSFGFYRS